jgi:hypothetical protein
VAINGTDATSGNAVEVALNPGSQDDSEIVTPVPVAVTAEDGTTATYTVLISRTNPNQSTHLRNLAVAGYELSPAFAPERQGDDVPYQVTSEPESGISTVKLTWEAGWTGQQVQVNGRTMAADTTEAIVDLQDGENTINVAANSYPGDFGNYVIKLTRKGAPWELRGFSAPVDMGEVWNTVKGGSTVPLKFEMFNHGVEITDPAMVKSFTATQVQCPGADTPTSDIEFLTTGGTQLSYQDGQFLQKWQAPKIAGSCIQVTMTAADNSQLKAHFIIR